ncbi:regulator of G-protein signaling 22-like [Clavelina lepadiformis]|uniref:regulator of G-protein signaling 22-like n=1 Tax=Clavelina lepadiformis TaxID=159417 RepID=UPI004042769A
MPEKTISTDPPYPEAEDFEEYLAIDDLFVDYFNAFLELPSFPEPLRFNPDTGGFEVLTPAKNQLADKIKAIARAQTPRSAVYKHAIANPPPRLPHYENDEEEDEEVKTSFNVKCLDKEQGIQWIKEHRLPTFLRSDLYMEYRLAKLLSQIETNRAGIKLTIDETFRPWHKQTKVERPPTAVDETIEMIERLKVTMGSMNATQTKEWFSVAKQVESTSVTSISRPVSSVTMPTMLPRRRTSSSRPISVCSSRNEIADNGDDYLGTGPHVKELSLNVPRRTSASSVVFSPMTSTAFPIREEYSACVVPRPVSSHTKVDHVVKIEPELSDSDSDQGVGSESDDIKEEIIEEKEDDEPGRSYLFDVNNLESYASVLVSLVFKKAIESLAPNITRKQLDKVTNLESIVTSSPRGRPLSRLNSKMFSEAILEHEQRVLDEQEILSRQSAKTMRSTKTQILASDVTRTESPTKKSIMFREKTESVFDDETDSVFSDESETSFQTISTRKQDFTDTKGFNRFRSFLQDTLGDKLVSLWLDIDKSRFAIRKEKSQKYLQHLRETYLKVGSTKRLPNEFLRKHQLLNATQWSVKRLQEIQRRVVEPLLLYWTPRFLVRQMARASKSAESDKVTSVETKSRDIRPLSSQSYPSPKTITVLPLRPKSCLPRLRNDKIITVERGRVLPDYHHYVKPDVYQTQHDPSPPLTTPSPIPSYLMPKVTAMVSDGQIQKLLLPKRPVSAGPLTRQTKVRFERRKSVAAKLRQRIRACSSVAPKSPATSVTSDSTVKGSPAMESMLQALYYDTRAGWFFTQFCENSKNMLWSSSIHFWFDVQEYHYLFYRDIFDQFTIERKSQAIYSTYIVGGSPEDIGLSVAIRRQVQMMIQPPFDELFDAAEEYVLKLLIVPWNRMMGMDKESYNKVELIEQERRLNVAAKYMGCLQKKGILKEKKVPLASEQQSLAKYEEDLWTKVPEEFRNVTFDELVRNRIELEHFRKFLEENYAKTDLLCWLDMEAFRRLPHQANEKRDEKAKDIKEKYLHKKYFFGPNSPATKQEQNEAVRIAGGWGKTLKERPPTELIAEAQKYVKKRIEKRWLPQFLATSTYQERQRPKSQMSEVADDVVLQKKKRRGEPWRMLDNRWQSSSRDLMEFRRALTNNITVGQFRRYVSVKGDFLENNVLFWLEVQKYKDFCHIHNESSAVESKVTSIINCFINSHIPPSLQIDIPNEMAEKLIEKRKELGPYVFREAQLTVFRVLFPHWTGFCEFRKTNSNLSDEKLTTTLERQRQKKLQRIRKQMKEQEEAALREEMKAQTEHESLDFPELGSLKGSDFADSFLSGGRTNNQMSWSYGKYVEGLERQKMLLLMENEVRGRVPQEALRDPDYDVSTVDSEEDSDADDGQSSTTVHASESSRRKKKPKEKIIHSTIKSPEATEIASEYTGDTNGKGNRNSPRDSKAKNSALLQKPGINNAANVPAVTVD